MTADAERIPDRSAATAAPERVVSTIQTSRPPFHGKPEIRAIDYADVRAAAAEGWRDFLSAPLYGLFFGGVFAAGGIALLFFLTVLKMPYLIIFLAVGFPLLGPFVAVGLYEISRRRAAGEPLTVSGVLGVVFRQRDRQLAWMAFVVLFVFWIWAYQIRLLIALFLGLAPISSLDGFVAALGTPDGLTFLAVGASVGAVLSFVLFSITALSMPMLVDRDVDIVTAVVASVQAVLSNPGPMLTWGVIVAALALLAMVPAFLGLLVVLPVLGHATWRLYARVVRWREPAAT